ncbi:MAG: FAD-dependent monooxygenase, partial [Brachymonas denitrificans]
MAYSSHDVCIRGSGIVGRTLALLLARHRLRVGLVESPAPAGNQPDIRAYALNHRSQRLLAGLKCWPGAERATPVLQMRVLGDGHAQTVFDAGRMDQEAMTWIVDVPTLEHMLQQACQYQSGIDIITADKADAAPAPLTVVCEGKHSTTRQQLGVDYDVTPYGQTAIATRARLDAPHLQIAWQWFNHTGSEGEILAFLPLDGPEGREVAIVWSVDRNRVDDLLALDDAAFAAHLQNAAHLQPSDAPNVIGVQRRVAWP